MGGPSVVALDEQHPRAGTGRGGRGPQSGQAGAQDHNVAHAPIIAQAAWRLRGLS
jgi:hypothetical protein